jgi:agmatine deiminase
MIPDWETNCVCFSRLLPDRHPGLWKHLTEILRKHRIPIALLEDTRDIWARDYCPIQVGHNRYVKFRYEPDYLRGRYKHLITGDDICKQIPDRSSCKRSGIVLDGGNLVAAKHRVILTDKAFRENPDWDKARLRAELQRLLEVDCILIPQDPDDEVIGHADGVVRFLTEDLVVVNDYRRVVPEYGRQLRGVLSRRGISIEEMPYFFEHRKVDGIDSAVGNYVNFLRVGDLILVPAYKTRHDDRACKLLERLCPRATVIPLPCTNLARTGGVLNCITWTYQSG